MGFQKRSYIEVGSEAYPESSSYLKEDPLQLFAFMLRQKYGGTDESERFNVRLLEGLIKKGKIPKSSIIWHDDIISRIYGFKVDQDGNIEYDISSLNNSPSRSPKRYVTSAPQIDMSALKNAIIRSKQVAI